MEPNISGTLNPSYEFLGEIIGIEEANSSNNYTTLYTVRFKKMRLTVLLVNNILITRMFLPCFLYC